MTSNSPFEFDDQTDEDFFDKLVDDDNDDGIIGVKSNDLVSSSIDEVNAFANLSLSEIDDPKRSETGLGSGYFGPEVSDGNVSGLGSVEAKEETGLGSGYLGPEVSDGNVSGLDSVVAKEETVVADSFSFDNGEVVEDGVGVGGLEGETGLRRESSGGVKEVQWSAFADSGDDDNGGFGSYGDFLTDFGQAVPVVGDVVNDGHVGFGSETNAIANPVTENAHGYGYTEVTEQIANGVDTNSVEYYESLYPGWKFDPTTGQWYEVDNTVGNAAVQESVEASGGNTQGNFDVSGEGQWGGSDVNSSQVFYSQQNAHGSVGTVTQVGTTESVSDWNLTSQQNGQYQYPAHMVFDPQYPEWYYDTLAKEWRSLEAYHASGQSTELMQNQQSQDVLSEANYSHGGNSQGINSNGFHVSGSGGANASQSYATSLGQFNQQGSNDVRSEFGVNSGSAVDYNVGQSWPNYDTNAYSNTNANTNSPSFPDSRGTIGSYVRTNQSLDSASWAGSNAVQSFNPAQLNGAVQYPSEYYGNQNVPTVSQPLFPNGHHGSFAQSETRSLTGRPPHALVSFGFGGKLLVMKETGTAGFSLHGSKDDGGHSLSVLNLMEVVGVKSGPSGTTACDSSYFQSLCHQSFPGPLVGGNAGSKELNRWVDERIAHCESMSGTDGRGEAPKLLLSLLKISCQHYGKLRTYGATAGLKDNDLPESAVASLFASAKRTNDQFGQSSASASSNCVTTLPSEAHIQVTASEVQNLLISGRKREALQRAQEGQFWGFALVLARELGDQFYTDTVKQMAVSQLVVGSPLRTLCLLIARKPEEVFSNNAMPAGNLPGGVAGSPQPAQIGGYSMLANWEENLAVIAANRTENDHLVITHLGDNLWKEKNDVTAAHICYLIAEAEFELYSDTSRLCLIGADHWNFPRTYANPEAIQRTELFEYAKVSGNSQFVLGSLHPYKLIYAHMLAEIGRVSESLKYCQAVYKVLKNGRSPEVDMLRQLSSSLEDRIRTHQQSGYAANLAPGKIVGRLLGLVDRTAHRVVGGLPPPAPSTALSNGNQYQSTGSKVRNSQSTMGMSSLTPSASMDPINQWAGDGNKTAFHIRSASEPDIGRTARPDQVDASNEATSSSADGKSSGSTGTSRFGRFNFGVNNILQKTVGLVLKPRQGHQAKLGDTNKFYYDEKLKRWVEEGAEPPAEEPALAPPPTTTAFQPERSDHYSNNASNNGLTFSGGSPEPVGSTPPGGGIGIPSFPPSSNQFSARGRMGVRSRYVDTFNKGGGASTNAFQAPSIPSSQPGNLPNAKFFIPAAASPSQPTFGTESGSGNDGFESEEHKSPMPVNDPFQNLTPSPAGTMQRFPSVDNISRRAMRSPNNSVVPQSRRTASWSSIPSEEYTSTQTTGVKASPLSFIPNNHSSGSLHHSGGSFGDDLHEVEL